AEREQPGDDDGDRDDDFWDGHLPASLRDDAGHGHRRQHATEDGGQERDLIGDGGGVVEAPHQVGRDHGVEDHVGYNSTGDEVLRTQDQDHGGHQRHGDHTDADGDDNFKGTHGVSLFPRLT